MQLCFNMCTSLGKSETSFGLSANFILLHRHKYIEDIVTLNMFSHQVLVRIFLGVAYLAVVM